MITYKHLALGVLAILLITGVSYATISPRLETDTVSTASVQSGAPSTAPVAAPDVRGEEEDDEGDYDDDDGLRGDGTVDDDDTETPSTPTPTPTPKPGTTPVVTTPPPTTPTTPAPTTPTGYTLRDVATHSSAESCWTIVNDSVYDLTSFVSKHPGGEKNILKICGRDGTAMFTSQHGGDAKPENTLAKYRLGAYVK